MRAQVAAGRTAAALSTYDRLPGGCATSSAPTRTTPRPSCTSRCCGRARPSRSDRPTGRPVPALIGREAELGRARPGLDRRRSARPAAWCSSRARPASARPGCSRPWSSSPGAPGGVCSRSRCHPTERSLFLQPYVDALRPVLLGRTSRRGRRGCCAGTPTPGSRCCPSSALVVRRGRRPGGLARPPAPPGVRRGRRRPASAGAPGTGAARRRRPAGRRRRHRGPARLPRRTAPGQPVCCSSGRSAPRTPAVVAGLADRAGVVQLGALPRLGGRRPGCGGRPRGPRRDGHGAHRRPPAERRGVPACPGRRRRRGSGARWPRPCSPALDRLDPEAREAGRRRRRCWAAGSTRELLAALTESDELSVVRHCEELVRVRLLVRSELGYEFANDLVQECVHAALPPALAAAYHRRAADLTTDRPETMAAHAFAAGDLERAARGWLLAGRGGDAAGRASTTRWRCSTGALAAAAAPGLRARLLLARARAHEARTAFAAALRGHRRGAAARARPGGPPAGDDRAAGPRRRRAGRRCGCRRPRSPRHLEAGLALASGLGDRRAEADFTTRLDGPGGQPAAAARPRWPAPSAGLARARASASPRTRWCSRLDGVKTVLRLPRRRRPARRGASPSSSRCCAAAGTPGCCSGRSSSRRSCRPRAATGTTPGARVDEALEAQPAQRVRRLRRLLHARTSAGSTGWPATSTPRWRTGRRPSRRPRRWTTRGGTPRRPACWPRPCSRWAAPTRPPASPARGLAATDAGHPGGLAAALPRPAGRRDRRRRRRCAAADAPLLAGVDCPPGRAWVVGRRLLPAGRPRLRRRAATRTRRPGALAPLAAATARPLGAGPRAGRRRAGSDQLGHQLSRDLSRRPSAPGGTTGRRPSSSTSASAIRPGSASR